MEIFTTGAATGLVAALRELLVEADGQVGVQAFQDRTGDAGIARLQPLPTAAGGRPVGLGWGPYHRGGPPHGSFLQITGAVTGDVPVPGRDLTLGALPAARAAGDRRALADRGRPLLHLTSPTAPGGIRQVLAAADMLRR